MQVAGADFSRVQLVRMAGCCACGGVVDCNPPELICPAVDNMRGKSHAFIPNDKTVDGLSAVDPWEA